MRKVIFLPFVFIALNAFGQATPPPPAQQPQAPPPPQQERPDFIVNLQMGADTLKNGQVTVKLTEQAIFEMTQTQASPNYTVILTPRGDCGPLTLFETNEKNFIVKQQKGSAPSQGIFDYVVMVKQKRPFMPLHAQRPPMPPQAPAQPGQPAPPAPPQQH